MQFITRNTKNKKKRPKVFIIGHQDVFALFYFFTSRRWNSQYVIFSGLKYQHSVLLQSHAHILIDLYRTKIDTMSQGYYSYGNPVAWLVPRGKAISGVPVFIFRRKRRKENLSFSLYTFLFVFLSLIIYRCLSLFPYFSCLLFVPMAFIFSPLSLWLPPLFISLSLYHWLY